MDILDMLAKGGVVWYVYNHGILEPAHVGRNQDGYGLGIPVNDTHWGNVRDISFVVRYNKK